MSKRTKTPPVAESAGMLPASGKAVNNVKVRMYCLGTGDCFILTFCHDDQVEFTMMIDCGSCRGGAGEFRPYIEHLAAYTKYKVDLLVVTHEHNDHVNGFAKCADIFKKFDIGEAWFAWTEDPVDPTGSAGELQKKRKAMKQAFSKTIDVIKSNNRLLKNKLTEHYFNSAIYESNEGLLNGLNTLAAINLPETGPGNKPLPGMAKIKELLAKKKKTPKYLNPGKTMRIDRAAGVKFHVLGPPMEREYVFKDGKEGVDVYNKRLSMNESSLAANAFLNMGSKSAGDLPFAARFVMNKENRDIAAKKVIKQYNDKEESWRKIDNDWLNSAGALALRLNSHINNTSLALAIEFDDSKKVLLFPGDAEYGSWESWYEIKKWKPKKAGDKHFVEDLLNRTVFYKVGHHLSYNGTALQKGIMMMEHNDLAAMATLDLERISEGWKKTMPNKFLLQELIRRSQGKLFIMNESGITDGPSKTLKPGMLGKDVYTIEYFPGTKDPVFIQYTCKV